MTDRKTCLPPSIAKWLASEKPALRQKAEAALSAAEPDTNDLLLAQIEKEQQSAQTQRLGRR